VSRSPSFAVLVLALASSACLLDPNPDFIEAGTSGDDEWSGECPAGTLDCDGLPGCEADVDDPATCGSCSKSCVVGDNVLECDAGQCRGVVMLDVRQDTYADLDEPDQVFGAEPVLRVDARRNVYLELGNLDIVPSQATIGTILLLLTATRSGELVTVHRVTSPWSQTTLTANNAPLIHGEVLAGFEPAIGENHVDLTGLFSPGQIGTPRYDVALRSDIEDDTIEFLSSETGLGPYLLITAHW
jgi:hypothetical protein